MNEELRKKLVQDLEKSGFHSEMMAIGACRTAGRECRGSVTYFDKDERRTRECDFEAVRKWQELRPDGTMVKVEAQLLGQVKKSETPWIVFTDRNPAKRVEDGLRSLLQVTPERERWPVGTALRDASPTVENGWTGSGIHEAFKKPADTSKWYSAFVSVCKACETAHETSKPVDRVNAQLIKPIVVLDGLLLMAELADDTQVALTAIDYAGFRFEYRSDRYERAAYSIDLVTLAALPRYLERTAERMPPILRMLMRDGAKR